MDPITQGLAVLEKLLEFGMKVYDDTPVPLRQQNAADWAMFFHNVSKQIILLQNKLAALQAQIQDAVEHKPAA